MSTVDFGGQYKRMIRFFWDPEPENDDETMDPIWCLGKEYPSRSKGLSLKLENKETSGYTATNELDIDKETVMISSHQSEDSNLKSLDTSSGVLISPANTGAAEERGWPVDFLDDFESRFWFTYRSHFPSIQKSADPNAPSSLSLTVRLRSQLVDQGGFTSDTGWGCMIRSGQCLLANTLGVLQMSREWRRGLQPQHERQLLSLFADDPRAPFSIHNFVSHGASACGKYPGEWFGPSATARCIQALSEAYNPIGLRVYVTGDGGDVYEDTFLKKAQSGGQSFDPVLILIGIRLGIDHVNPVYWEALKMTLQLPQSVGIAGGRPSASHYFVGVQGDNFFYLDPHQTRPMLPYYLHGSQYSEEDMSSCHTRRLRRLHVESMDPSMLIAFLIHDEEDWRIWRNSVAKVQGKPIVNIADNEPPVHGEGAERNSALEEVEAFDDDEDGECELIEPPST